MSHNSTTNRPGYRYHLVQTNYEMLMYCLHYNNEKSGRVYFYSNGYKMTVTFVFAKADETDVLKFYKNKTIPHKG